MRLFILLAVGVSLSGCLAHWPRSPRAAQANDACVLALAQADLQRAETECDLGLEYSPADAELLSNRGLVALRRGQTREAKQFFLRAVRSNPDFAAGYNNLGVLALREDPRRAADLFRQALARNPHYPDARLNLARALEQDQAFAPAEKEYRTLTSVAPNLAEPHFHLGRLAVREARWDEATEHLRQAVLLRADYREAWGLLALSLNASGHPEEAKEALAACADGGEPCPATLPPGAHTSDRWR